MTEKVEKWNVNESFMTNPSYNSLSKCQQELAISYLKAKCAPLSPFVLFLSSLSAGHFFSIFKMLGVTERASLRRPTRPVLMLFVGLSLLPGSALLSDSSCTSQNHIWCIEMWSPKTSQIHGSPLQWKLHVMTRLNPGRWIQESRGAAWGGTGKAIFELHTCLTQWQRHQVAPVSVEAEQIMWT